MGYFTNAGVFLLHVVFGLYIFAVMLRFYLQLVRANFRNPICEAIVTITNPPLRPMRRYIPAIGRVDTSTVLLMLALQLLNNWLEQIILGASGNFSALLVMSLARLLEKSVWLFIIAILIQVVISWVAPQSYNPLTPILDSLTRPLLNPVQKYIPPLAGLDLSPLVVLIFLQLMLILLVAPVWDIGQSLL